MVKLDIQITDLDFWATVPTAVVTAYLEGSGWKTGRPSPLFAIHSLAGCEVHVPKQNLENYGRLMRRAVETIATAEKSPLLPLLDRMDINWVSYAGEMANVNQLGVLML